MTIIIFQLVIYQNKSSYLIHSLLIVLSSIKLFYLAFCSQMRLSHKSMILSSYSPKQSLKRPKQLITKLNSQIQTIQSTIKQYNEAQRKSFDWKKKMNISVNSCQLKALSQPKFQKVLLQSDFFNNMAIFGKNCNQSGIKASVIKLNNSNKKSSMQNASGSGMRKTMILKEDGGYSNKKKNQQNESGKIKKNTLMKSKGAAEHPQHEQNPEGQFNNFRPSFKSFRQQISKYDRLVYTKSNHKQNYSVKRNASQVSNMHQNTPSRNIFSQSIVFNENMFKESSSFIDEQSESVMMQSSMKFINHSFHNSTSLGNQHSKQLGLIPISQEKLITMPSQRNSSNLRRKIQQKTLKLQKQWLKTQCYKEKFNIVPDTMVKQSKIYQHKTKQSRSKLANIIHKVQERRPSTSFSQQRTTKTSRQNTFVQNFI